MNKGLIILLLILAFSLLVLILEYNKQAESDKETNIFTGKTILDPEMADPVIHEPVNNVKNDNLLGP